MASRWAVGRVERRTSSSTSEGRSTYFGGVPCGRPPARGCKDFGHVSEGNEAKGRRARAGGPFERCLGGDLLSHPVARAVPSALEGLTAGFGMGPGVSLRHDHRNGVSRSVGRW